MRQRNSARVAILLTACVLVLSACPTRVKQEPPTAQSQRIRTPEETQALPGTGPLYRILPQESLLMILVYRGGALARAGHNHVIASHDVSGTVRIGRDIAESSFQLQFPVSQLTVDEPRLRAREGADFAAEVPEAAREGTRRNLLSDAVLAGESFPDITLRSERITSGPEGILAQVQVIVRDQVRSIAVPLHYEIGAGRLLASGEFPLKQTDLGLTPFSVMMGALQVQDEMRIKLSVVAQRQ